MSEWPHLPKAPITEALIDIRVRLPEATDLEQLAPFRDQVRDDYPTCRERQQWGGQLQFKGSEPPVVRAGSVHPDGYLLTSADGCQVAQARLDGFTFSRLKPYQTWTTLRASAQLLWQTYCRVAKPEMATRIAVRYINRLELPLPCKDFRDWVRTTPDVPPGLPQRLAGFFLRLHIPFEEPHGLVNLIQALEPGEYPEHVPLLFDIDAFRPVELDPGDDEIWRQMDALRIIKNRVFFQSITEKLKERYL